MDFAKQVGVGIYPSKATVYEHIARGVFCEPADFGTYLEAEKGTALSCPVENKAVFFYSEFGCFIEFIRRRHGDREFRTFLKDIAGSDELNVDKSFVNAFGVSMNDGMDEFVAETRRR